MAFGLFGRNGVLSRPPNSADISKFKSPPQSRWAKDKSYPGATDGYELTAADVNEIVGQLRHLLTALGGNSAGSNGTELASAMTTALAAKASVAAGIAGLPDSGGYVRMTDAEREKLSAVTLGYRGAYATLAALVAARPTGVAGDWAIITQGVGNGATMAVWDSDNSPAAWVDTGIAPTTVGWGSVTGRPVGLDSIAALVSDWDSATGNGFYQSNAAANDPSGAGGPSGRYIGVVEVRAAGYLTQTAHAIGESIVSGATWRREQAAGVWGAWAPLQPTLTEYDIRTALGYEPAREPRNTYGTVRTSPGVHYCSVKDNKKLHIINSGMTTLNVEHCPQGMILPILTDAAAGALARIDTGRSALKSVLRSGVRFGAVGFQSVVLRAGSFAELEFRDAGRPFIRGESAIGVRLVLPLWTAGGVVSPPANPEKVTYHWFEVDQGYYTYCARINVSANSTYTVVIPTNLNFPGSVDAVTQWYYDNATVSEVDIHSNAAAVAGAVTPHMGALTKTSGVTSVVIHAEQMPALTAVVVRIRGLLPQVT